MIEEIFGFGGFGIISELELMIVYDLPSSSAYSTRLSDC